MTPVTNQTLTAPKARSRMQVRQIVVRAGRAHVARAEVVLQAVAGEDGITADGVAEAVAVETETAVAVAVVLAANENVR